MSFGTRKAWRVQSLFLIISCLYISYSSQQTVDDKKQIYYRQGLLYLFSFSFTLYVFMVVYYSVLLLPMTIKP